MTLESQRAAREPGETTTRDRVFSTGPVIRRGKDKGTKGGATTRSNETGPGEPTESRQSGPSTTSVDGEVGPRISGRKPKQLGEKFLAFAIHAPRGFKQESGKVEGGTLEVCVILAVFEVSRAVFSRRVSGEVGGGERAGDGNVYTKPFAFTPQGNGHIPWSAARVLALTQDSLLLHDRAQVSLAGDLVDEIADSVVADNEVPIRAAADRMISINI